MKFLIVFLTALVLVFACKLRIDESSTLASDGPYEAGKFHYNVETKILKLNKDKGDEVLHLQDNCKVYCEEVVQRFGEATFFLKRLTIVRTGIVKSGVLKLTLSLLDDFFRREFGILK